MKAFMFGAGVLMASSSFAREQLSAVPYLGADEPYFLGSGVAGAGGTTKGKWDFLIGPDYTSPTFISEETLSLVIDGNRHELSLSMHRARETGIFFGSQTFGDVTVHVADVTTNESTWVGRLIRVTNRSRVNRHEISIVASIVPSSGTHSIENGEALQISMDTNAYCFGNRETKNWAPRSSTIRFNEPCKAVVVAKGAEISTLETVVHAGGTHSFGLYHFQRYDKEIDLSSALAAIKKRRPETDLAEGISDWKKWFSKGKSFASKVKDPKARDVIEGSLVACKMQQNRDGGTIAGTRKYANSYIRDTHGGLRLFLATGHVAEAKKAIETVFHKWSVAGFIPNYWSMGSDTFLGRSFINDNSEITGYYVMMIRDYYASTKDRAFVDLVAPSMKFAIDSQLDFMQANGWRITFNGDETEQYCAREDGQEYGGFPAFAEWKKDSWSFPSAVIACASTQFYIDYLESRNPSLANRYRVKLEKVKNAIDSDFWDSKVGYHRWARFADGSWPVSMVPNYGLIPVWAGTTLNNGREKTDALATMSFVNAKTGYLPTVPMVVDGFCGHNMGYLLYGLKKLNDPRADGVYKTIMNSKLIGCWGTVSEFYGPGGVPNGHNFREFESGINGEALLRYFIGF